ncbi:hypothetical protein [Acinetobacter pittii]|uniref:hypothetical protein n=1 Tax=Acinetobacter pittii TaxID=48296 RepID=UPI000E6ACB31|nr:hypothetical protein [Acinetobacter pittii]
MKDNIQINGDLIHTEINNELKGILATLSSSLKNIDFFKKKFLSQIGLIETNKINFDNFLKNAPLLIDSDFFKKIDDNILRNLDNTSFILTNTCGRISGLSVDFNEYLDFGILNAGARRIEHHTHYLKSINYKLGSQLDELISKLSNSSSQDKKDIEYLNQTINDIKDKKNQIFSLSEKSLEIARSYLENLESSVSSILKLKDFHDKRFYELAENFKKNNDFIIKKHESNIKNLTENFNIKFNELQLENDNLLQNSKLMKKKYEEGFLKLNELNNKNDEMTNYLSQEIKNKMDIIDLELESTKNLCLNEIRAMRNRTYAQTKKLKIAQDDFVKLVENAGIYNLTENYKKKALEEKGDYEFNRNITIGAIIGAILTTVVVIGIPIYEYWQHNPPIEQNYYTLFARFTVSIMFFVLAVYTSKQASKHYECYQENNRTFLQLAALEPFMERMSEDEQKTIRKGLIPIYFNQNPDEKFTSKTEEVALPTDIKAIAEKIIDVGKTLIEKSSDQSKPSGS